MARNKILIERGRLVVTDPSGEMVLGAELSKSHPGRIDVHMGGLIGHMEYAQALAEFRKEKVPVEAFEQAFSRLKKKMKPNTTTEFGIFSDEGLLERDFWSREEAETAAHDRYSPDDAVEVHEMCPEPGHDEPRHFCGQCDVED